MPAAQIAIQLTAAEERFCKEFAVTRNAMVAYAKAFPMYHDARTHRLEGGELLRSPHIKFRIDELVESSAEVYNFTIEEHLLELKRIREGAFDNKQFRVALEAEVTRGKLMGFYQNIDQPKSEQHLHMHGAPKEDVTDDARASAIIRMLKEKLKTDERPD